MTNVLSNEQLWCSRCERSLTIEAFAPSQRTSGAWCRDCRREYQRNYNHDRLSRQERMCLDCGKTYARWCFWKHPGAAGRRCHPCYLEYTRRRQTPHPKRKKINKRGRPEDNRWKEVQAQVFADETHCGICGEFVDQGLDHRDRLSRTVDHIVPLWRGGDYYERANLQLAHRSCNAKAGNRSKAEFAAERLALTRAALWLSEAIA